MEYSEPLYEDRDTTGSCGDKEPVMQPDQVEGTNGVSSRYCPDEVHQEIIPGSHDTTSGSVLGPVGQPNLREVDSVLSSKGRTDKIREYNTDGSHATTHGSGLGLIRQPTLRKDESTEITQSSQAAIIQGSGLGCVEQSICHEDEISSQVENGVSNANEESTAVPNIKPMQIPEFDPQKNYATMPKWMSYDPSKVDGHAKYICIVCNKPVGNDQERVEEHAKGKKHIHYMKNRGNLCYQTYEFVATSLKEEYNLELCMFTKENNHMLSAALRSMTECKDSIISVGFASKNGFILCLCFVWNGICMNIDRTILDNRQIMNKVVELKKIFESACTVGGKNMWELILLLFRRYGIRCQDVADVDQRSIDHAGVDVPRCNSKLHQQVAIDAAESYEFLESVELKLLNVSKIPARVLHHLYRQNLDMYAVYREIREANLEVA